jgi:hypothetical protein
MATVVVKTIGTGGDYTSVQSWEDAAPVNLVTADQIWEGRVLSQKLTPSAGITIGGATTNASCYKHLTAQTGASFIDNPTHTLMWDENNGATIKRADNYSDVISLAEQYVKISRLQIGTARVPIAVGDTADNLIVDSCSILTIRREAVSGSNAVRAFVINSLLLSDTPDTAYAIVSRNLTLYGCTLGNVETGTGFGVGPDYGTSYIYNCVFANISSVASSKPGQVICENCYTTGTTHPGCTVVALDQTTGTGFVNASMTIATGNLKLNPTSALVGTAGTYPPYTDDDIYGTLRGADPDVGAYEIPASGGATHPSTGNVVGNTATVTGTAARSATVQTHPTTGAVVGNTATVSGTALRYRVHPTTGAVTGLTSTVTGTAKRYRLHTTTGAVTGLTSTVTGTATNEPAAGVHEVDGVVTGTTGAVTGSALHIGVHRTTGVVAGYQGAVTGTAKNYTVHETTGVLSGFSAEVVGAAQRSGAVIVHGTSGVLAGYDSVVTGAATNMGGMTLTPADIQAIVAAIKAEIMPVDIVRVNHIDVDGTGIAGDEWGPV